MLSVRATSINPESPLTGLAVDDQHELQVPDGWTRVAVKAAALNHHDLWTLKGVGIRPDRLPIVLGCDAAGIDEHGNEVIVHAVIGDPSAGQGDETLDPKRSLLSEVYDGTLAEWVAVPARNVVPKPAEMSWEQAACLPTAWLTAYRMLFTRGNVQPGEIVLIQGAGGGVATALIVLARAAGAIVWATSRDAEKRAMAAELGAHAVFESGARLPQRVDAVMETVGQATWAHTLKSLRPGGRVVVSGATTGAQPQADLARVFFLQLSVMGSTMGTRNELERLAAMCVANGIEPLIDSTYAMDNAREAFLRLASGAAFGKIVLTT